MRASPHMRISERCESLNPLLVVWPMRSRHGLLCPPKLKTLQNKAKQSEANKQSAPSTIDVLSLFVSFVIGSY